MRILFLILLVVSCTQEPTEKDIIEHAREIRADRIWDEECLTAPRKSRLEYLCRVKLKSGAEFCITYRFQSGFALPCDIFHKYQEDLENEN